MKKTSLSIALATGIAMAFVSCKTDTNTQLPNDAALTPTLPYTLQLVEYVNSSLPNLHSFTHGTYQDKIIMFGGRRKGLHASTYSFSQGAANKIIYVIDTHSWSASVSTWSVYSRADSLTVPVSNISCAVAKNAGQFRANNAEFFTNGNTLYVIGGLVNAAPTSSTSQGGVITLPYIDCGRPWPTCNCRYE
jgi:hypothetical protein